MESASVSRSSRSANPATIRDWISEVSREAKPKPAAVVCYGPPGVGKSSIGAATVKPVFMIDDQEDGINTLKASNLVPSEIPVLPAVSTWNDVFGQLDALADEHDFRTLVVDTLGGLERLCHAYVCEREFKGIWGEKGFGGYQRGYEVALPEWRRLLIAFDRLRTERKMQIFCISHSLVRPFKNPAAEDYDRFVLDLHHKTWSVTSKWADIVLFANYFVAIDKGKSDRERPKGKGGQDRVMYTEYEAAFDAKNRHNLPPEISMGSSGKEAWSNLVTAIKNGKDNS